MLAVVEQTETSAGPLERGSPPVDQTLIEIREYLKEIRNLKAGPTWSQMLSALFVAAAIPFCIGLIAYGSLTNQVKTNTDLNKSQDEHMISIDGRVGTAERAVEGMQALVKQLVIDQAATQGRITALEDGARDLRVQMAPIADIREQQKTNASRAEQNQTAVQTALQSIASQLGESNANNKTLNARLDSLAAAIDRERQDREHQQQYGGPYGPYSNYGRDGDGREPTGPVAPGDGHSPRSELGRDLADDPKKVFTGPFQDPYRQPSLERRLGLSLPPSPGFVYE
jgi:hypothetical protein